MADIKDGHAGDRREEVFLDRWSRRKLAEHKDAAVAGADPADTMVAGVPEQEDTPAVAADPQQALTDADMPPVDMLDSDSDFSVFMSPGVSEQLRRQALRKLFHLPAFNVTDGLNDYDEDYTRFAGLGSVVTHEMKRMLKRELEAKEVSQQPDRPEQAAVTEDGVPDSEAGTTATDDADSGNPQDCMNAAQRITPGDQGQHSSEAVHDKE